MSRDAYIAGKNTPVGTSTPPVFSSSSEQKSFQAAQDEKAYVEKAKGNPTNNPNVDSYQFQTESYQNAPSPEDVSKETKKDPYDVLTRQEEIQAGYPKTALERLQEASGVKLVSPTLQFMGIGAKALQGLLDKTFKPQVSDFSNPNFLAVLDAAFRSGRLNKDEYTEKYKDLLDDVYSGQVKEDLEAGLGSLDSKGMFDLAMEEATANVEPGSGTQRITNPEAFYEDFTPQTSGDLANLAGLDVSSNPALADRIFAARMELDRMGKDMFGNTQGSPNQGGGGGFVPPATTPDDPMIPQDPTLPPGITPPATTPKFPGSVVTDYTQLGLPQIYGNPQMPNYATFNRAGSMPVGLQDYLDNLRKRFGIG